MTNTAASLDSTTIILIGGQIVLVLGAVVTGIIAIITHLRVGAVSTQQAATTDKLNTVAASTEAIKGHVNSEKTAAEGRETALAQENRLLREMLADAKSTAGLLAQAKVVGDVRPPLPLVTVSAPPAPPAPMEQKAEVENTKAVKANTAAVKENTDKQ